MRQAITCVLLALAITGCAPSTPAPQSDPASAVDVEKEKPPTTAAPAAPEREEFLDSDEGQDRGHPSSVVDEEQKALAGDYTAQRNLAYSMSQPDSAKHNPMMGCAWRIVIVDSGSPKVDQSDTGNLEFDCGKLGAVEQRAAEAQAARLKAEIEKK